MDAKKVTDRAVSSKKPISGEKYESKKRNLIIGLVAFVIIVAVSGVTLWHPAKKSAASGQTVKVGIMSGDKQDQAVWKSVAKTAQDT